MLYLILLFLFSCEKIVLKRGERIPFKIEKGSYVVTLYKLNYPEQVEDKQNFLKKFGETMSTKVIEKHKISLLLNEQFMKDYMEINEKGILTAEKFVKNSASSLTDEEKEKLFSLLGVPNEKYKVKEILNLQVKYLLKMLGKAEAFVEGKSYTELFKEQAFSDLWKVRKRWIKILQRKEVELFIILDSIYSQENKKEFEYRKHYYTKDIDLSRGGKFSDEYKEYKDKALFFIQDMKSGDMDSILAADLSLDMKNFILNNERFTGYKVLGSKGVVFPYGGKKELFEDSDYKVSVAIEEIDLEQLKDINIKFGLKDMYIAKDEKEEKKKKRKEEREAKIKEEVEAKKVQEEKEKREQSEKEITEEK